MLRRLLAITPSKSKALPWDQVRTICYDYTATGIETLSEIATNSSSNDNNKPLRFVYASGANTVRDPAKKPWILGDYLLLRVRTYKTPQHERRMKQKGQSLLASFTHLTFLFLFLVSFSFCHPSRLL